MVQELLGAELVTDPPMKMGDLIMHALLKVGDSSIMVHDSMADENVHPTNAYVYVEDLDLLSLKAEERGTCELFFILATWQSALENRWKLKQVST
jgi:uncharacterized glyoxalase superfamily protein PhnB